MVANIIAVSTLNTAARCKLTPWVKMLVHRVQGVESNIDVAMMLMPGSFYSAAVVVLSWITGTLSQPSIKRASAIALINAICNTPNGMLIKLPRILAFILIPNFQCGPRISTTPVRGI